MSLRFTNIHEHVAWAIGQQKAPSVRERVWRAWRALRGHRPIIYINGPIEVTDTIRCSEDVWFVGEHHFPMRPIPTRSNPGGSS